VTFEKSSQIADILVAVEKPLGCAIVGVRSPNPLYARVARQVGRPDPYKN